MGAAQGESGMKFEVGDKVKPKPEHAADKSIPYGRVVEVRPWGEGQLLRVDKNSRVHPAGYFERDE